MTSTYSGAVTKLYQAWLAPSAEDDLVQSPQQWDVLTTEPGGVDYIETDANGVPCLWAIPKGASEDHVLLCIHGGGFVSGSIYTHRKMFAHLAKAAGVRALIVGYRILPEGVHPVPVNDVVAAYRWLLDQGVDAHHIAFTGDSAGGGLSITAQLVARDQGLPVPAASMPLSPWVDMEITAESIHTNQGKDVLFNAAWIKQMADDFLGHTQSGPGHRLGTDPQDPYVNPLYADLRGLGPIYIQVGEPELLLDDSRNLAKRAQAAGVEVRLDIYPDQQHTFQ